MRDEEGAVAITVAVCLLVLMAFTSIALDVSSGYESRRRTVNSADAAALAAAWEDCNPVDSATPDPVGAALEVAALNGYDNAAPDVSVAVIEVADGEFEVSIASRVDSAFGAAGGIDGDGAMTVVSRSVAACVVHPFLGGYALFASGPASCTGGVELDLSGASKLINGGLHSNGDIKVTGSDTEINGDVTYVGGSNYEPSAQLATEPPSPLDIDISEFAPGGARAAAAAALGAYVDATGNTIDNSYLTANGYATGTGGSVTITHSGIYYTDDDISLTNATAAPGVQVTFVAHGQISVQGSGDFTAFEPLTGTGTDPGLLMFSNYLDPAAGGPTCTGNAIQWSVSSGTWTGVIYAPNGAARQSSASNSSLNGSIIAYTVDLSGADFSITWLDNPGETPDYEVELLR